MIKKSAFYYNIVNPSNKLYIQNSVARSENTSTKYYNITEIIFRIKTICTAIQFNLFRQDVNLFLWLGTAP